MDILATMWTMTSEQLVWRFPREKKSPDVTFLLRCCPYINILIKSSTPKGDYIDAED